jgi:hypothetical protein
LIDVLFPAVRDGAGMIGDVQNSLRQR